MGKRKRSVYVIGNWKMNQGLEDIALFFKTFENQRLKKSKEGGAEVWVAPQSIHLGVCAPLARKAGVFLGAQNCSAHLQGAYTGEISSRALAEMGVVFTLVGHSERRTLFGEDQSVLRHKTETALKQGLFVVFCLGETLQQKNNQETFSVLEEQVISSLQGVAPLISSPRQLILAYEPVWAIGTGQTATPEEANEAQGFLRKILEKVGLKGESHSILYGGSVKSSHIEELMSKPHIDGVLVGGASLDPVEFFRLVECAETLSG